jgi:hypothetical protein
MTGHHRRLGFLFVAWLFACNIVGVALAAFADWGHAGYLLFMEVSSVFALIGFMAHALAIRQQEKKKGTISAT